MPTARRSRAAAVSPTARRISSRKRRPVTGRGSSTTSSVTGSASEALPSTIRRTVVGRRTPSTGCSVRRCTVRSAPVHSIQAGRPSSQAPSHGRALPSNALEARCSGRPSKRPEPRKVPRTPTSRSNASSARRRPRWPSRPASTRGRSAARRRGAGRFPRPVGRARAPRPTGRASGCGGTGRRPWCAGRGRSARRPCPPAPARRRSGRAAPHARGAR